MNTRSGSLRPQLMSRGIICFVLLACANASPGHSHTGTATQAARLGREFKLRASRQVTLQPEGLRIRFVAVTEDSRCPADVQCIWAGNAAVRLEVSLRGRDPKSLTLNTNSGSAVVNDNQYPGYTIKLVQLSPYPRSNRKIAAADYIASLLVVRAENQPRVAEIDRVRLAEAFRIGEKLGNQVWRGWSKAPFAVLLVTPEQEFLIRHPRPSPDFALIGYDPLLKSNIYFRKRTQPVTFLATFPAVSGIPTIVIGQAENTARKTSTPWVVTMLHEHFHQLQYSQPTYYQEVAGLDLSRGDQTGMWMLNYPFPYDWPEMKEHFSHLSTLLADALQARDKSQFAAKLSAYRKQREELGKTLSPDDYRYFSFQMWQEGIARYTEYRIAKLAAGNYKPSTAFRALKDYVPFTVVADQIKTGILNELTTGELKDYKRVKFYALGAGEGLLLDRINPRWQRRYFEQKFYLDQYFNPAH